MKPTTNCVKCGKYALWHLPDDEGKLSKWICKECWKKIFDEI